ncbi:MAG: biopolymer transporter ExbD [Candidatus Omnitrophica bacterium]|nr:biopolymer transporter ExbD [Candidatus Omnitrophota bacterium]
MDFLKKQRIKVNLNIAPLIDIIFLLLMFFMLSYHFALNPGINLSLPESKTATINENNEEIIIYITSNQEIYLNQERTSQEELLEALKTKIASTKSTNIMIKGDRRIELGLAVKIIDIAEQANVENIILSTESANYEE